MRYLVLCKLRYQAAAQLELIDIELRTYFYGASMV